MNAAGEKWPPATGKGLRAGTQAGGLDARGGTYGPLALVSSSTDGCEGGRRGHHDTPAGQCGAAASACRPRVALFPHGAPQSTFVDALPFARPEHVEHGRLAMALLKIELLDLAIDARPDDAVHDVFASLGARRCRQREADDARKSAQGKSDLHGSLV